VPGEAEGVAREAGGRSVTSKRKKTSAGRNLIIRV
jgi:hypothetical protein